MWDKAAGRIAVFLVAGLFVGLTSVLGTEKAVAAANQAAGTDPQKPAHAIRHSSRHAARSSKPATKVSSADKADPSKASDKPSATAAKPAATEQNALSQNVLALPASVADANAQFIENSDNAPNGQTAAADQQQATPYMVAADQINEIDLAASGLPAPKPITLSMENRDDTDVTQTSLIGRIFIAIGGLLTIGSAVRLFMV